VSASYRGGMPTDFAHVGRLLAAPARSAMLDLLLDGQAHTAGDLAAAAGVRAPTASEHLAALVDGGLVRVRSSGRHRYFELADAQTAAALEAVGHLCPSPPVTSLRLSREQRRLRQARTCYDHLAGQLGVALHDGLVARGWLDGPSSAVTASGDEGFVALRIDLDALRRHRRALTRSCLDWTERRPHLAGSLGAAVATAFFENGWVTRKTGSRGLTITDPGRRALETTFGADPATWPGALAS